jgi:hypothetical protein
MSVANHPMARMHYVWCADPPSLLLIRCGSNGPGAEAASDPTQKSHIFRRSCSRSWSKDSEALSVAGAMIRPN